MGYENTGCKEIAEKLEELKHLVEAIRSGEYCCLRYGLPYIRASDIAALSLCPLRKHYEIINYSSEKISQMNTSLPLLARIIIQAKKNIPSGKTSFFLDTPVPAIIRGVPVVGRPTALIVEECRVNAVLVVREAKHTTKPTLYEETLLQVYGALVDFSPLPSGTSIRLFLVKREKKEALDVLKKLSDYATNSRREWYGELKETNIYIYDREDFLERYHILIDYWKHEEIKPLPRPLKNTCRKCPFRSLCPNPAN